MQPPNSGPAFTQQLLERLPAVGGVTAASAATSVPYGGVVPQRLDVEGAGPASPEQAATVSTVSVDTGYFAVFSLPLRLGRDFSADDGRPGRESAIVNQRFVDVHLKDRDPIGLRVRLAPAAGTTVASPWLTIVGVAEDIRQRNAAAEPVVYTPLRAAAPATLSILLRSTLNPEDATRLLRQEVMAIDPALPLYRIATMAKSIEDAQWNGRVSHRLITGLTLIAVLISIVGLYAVTSHSVNQRTQELGVRMALGARARNVCALILRRAAVQVGLGLALGLGGSILWSSAFATERVELRLIDVRCVLVGVRVDRDRDARRLRGAAAARHQRESGHGAPRSVGRLSRSQPATRSRSTSAAYSASVSTSRYAPSSSIGTLRMVRRVRMNHGLGAVLRIGAQQLVEDRAVEDDRVPVFVTSRRAHDGRARRAPLPHDRHHRRR